MSDKSIPKSPRLTPVVAPAAAVIVPRRPRQNRGQARVGVILDAAAALIGEAGVGAVTMHGVARRAQTSIGSMYYFFPDRERLLQALVERHIAATRAIGSQLQAIPTPVWRELSSAELIERLVTPYVDYLSHQVDFLPLMYGRALPESSTDFICTISYVLAIRLPSLPPELREAYATMLHSMAVGSIQTAFQVAPELTDFFLGEIQRAMTVYLIDLEATASA